MRMCVGEPTKPVSMSSAGLDVPPLLCACLCVPAQDIYEKHVYVPTVGQAACVSVHDGNTDVCSGTT